MVKQFSAAQRRAQRLFAQRARAGTLRKGSKLRAPAPAKPRRKRNPHRARKVAHALRRARSRSKVHRRSAPSQVHRMARKSKKNGRRISAPIKLGAALPLLKISAELLFGRAGVTNGVVNTVQAQGPGAAALELLNAACVEFTGYNPAIGGGSPGFNAAPVTENVTLAVAGWGAGKVATAMGANRALRKLGVRKVAI